jgi:hypothetical protein
MQCDQCGQPLDMICLDCDSHLFQITISHNAKARLKGRWKLLEKASAKYKELRQTVIFLRIGITITVTGSLSLAGWVVRLMKSKAPDQPKLTSTCVSRDGVDGLPRVCLIRLCSF